VEEFQAKLSAAQQEVKRGPTPRPVHGFSGRWLGLTREYRHDPVDTAVAAETLERITEAVTRVPESFHLHPRIAKLLESRRADLAQRRPIDWAFAETLAFGTLLLEGTAVRLSGQDSRRGTFSQRHAVLCDRQTGAEYWPLDHLGPDQAPLRVYDSLLAEASVLGFEFGYSLDDPRTLVLWEAQFGDFVNGAQVIIDQFLVCSESKWQRSSGVVLLLPHGYEGQGPEHSSARLERFLQACAEDNIQVAYPSTPAQYFHILRRQMKRSFRKPLVLMTPKSLLRHRLAVSPLEEFTAGRFHEVLDATPADPGRVRRLLLCSGKVYYDLLDGLGQADGDAIAIVRIEQFYPFPEELLRQTLARYRRAREWVWVQEESQNMGGWTFMEPRLRALGYDFQYIGRDASASPATGSFRLHQREQKELVEAALKHSAPYLVRAADGVAGQPVKRHPAAERQPRRARPRR
jgi:2-oxoglutarate dehydrogenase E1 component